MPNTPVEGDLPATGILNLSQIPLTFYTSSTSFNISEDVSRRQEERNSSTWQYSQDTNYFPKDPVEERVTDLMHFLILKY